MAKSKSNKKPTSKASNTTDDLSKSSQKVINIHDAFFKNTFSYPEIAKEYIAKFMEKDLVKNIDLESLELEPTSYVTSELTEYFSDLVWNVKYKATNVKISFLFEHKSYLVQYPHPQLLRYILEHIDIQIKAKTPLTVVIPIVVYHGDKEWKVREFSDYFEGVDEHLKKYIPNFHYNLTNVHDYTKEELIEMGIGKLLNVFLAMLYARNVKFLLENYEAVFLFAEKDLENNEYLDFYNTIIVYLFKNVKIGNDQLQKIVTSVNEPLKKITMSAYDLLIEKGIEKGINLGEDKKARKVILTLIAKFPDWSDSQIAEIANTTVVFVQQIRIELAGQN